MKNQLSSNGDTNPDIGKPIRMAFTPSAGLTAYDAEQTIATHRFTLKSHKTPGSRLKCFLINKPPAIN